jgi:VWFA-related protein
MKAEPSSRALRRLVVWLLILIVCGVGWSAFGGRFATGQQEGSQQQQRPRRATNSNNNTNSNQNSAAEEVAEGDVIRVETQLVSVPAIVTNELGRPLPGLRPESFLLFEDGSRQAIATFGTTEAPFEIALLLDTSGSTRDDVGLIRQAANSFIEALRPGDRVALIAFNTAGEGSNSLAKVEVLSTLTSDRKALRQVVDHLGASNGTPYYDALKRIADEIFREPPPAEVHGRRAVVALTDGVDSSSDSDYAEARGKLLRSGVATYFIQVNTEDFVEDRLLRDCQADGRLTLSAKQLQRYRRIFLPGAKSDAVSDFCQMGQFERMDISRQLYSLARREMDDLARASGGRNVVAATLPEARAAFARVAADIGTQYSLGYYPTNKARDGKYRAIRVEVHGVKGKTDVRARQGYYAQKGQ